MNGDLFLIRHLLILREQLIPFNIKLQKKNLNLDFLPSKKALNYFVMNNVKSIINFNGNGNGNINGNSNNNSNLGNNYSNNEGSSFSSNTGSSSGSYFYNNSFFQLAREGLPGIVEKEIFIKKDLDLDLKNACQALKDSVLKSIFGAMDSFLAKITAFVGDFTTSTTTSTQQSSTYATSNSGQLPALSAESSQNLKKQDFMKIERVREMLISVQETVAESAPEFMNSMKVRRRTFLTSTNVTNYTYFCSCTCNSFPKHLFNL